MFVTPVPRLLSDRDVGSVHAGQQGGQVPRIVAEIGIHVDDKIVAVTDRPPADIALLGFAACSWSSERVQIAGTSYAPITRAVNSASPNSSAAATAATRC